MKNFLFLLIFLPLFLCAQTTFYRNDVIGNYKQDFNYTVSDADSIFFYNDTLWMAGADSIDLILPLKKTLGMIRIKGTGTGTSILSEVRHGTDTTITTFSGDGSVVFKIGPHNGNGSAANSNITLSLSTLGTFTHTAAENDSTSGFSYYPLEAVSALKDEACAYWTLRLVNTTGTLMGIWFELEYIDAY